VRLADLLRADRTVVPLKGRTVMDAARTLVEQLAATGAVRDVERLWERVEEARPEDLVAMGDRAFLLHYRTEVVDALSVAVGTSPVPICRELGDGERQCARILLLVVAPPGFAAQYLQAVSAFARFLSNAARVDAILAQATADALVTMPELREAELPAQLTVREMMSDRPFITHVDTPLRAAAQEMVRARVGALPVVDADGRLIGMLTDRDLVLELLGSHLQLGAPAHLPTGHPGRRRTVRDIMTRQVMCVSPDQPLAEAASLMSHKDVDRVPVVQDGRLVGFLTRGDIVRKLVGS
jgi:CBS domain-containing protein